MGELGHRGKNPKIFTWKRRDFCHCFF